MGYRLVDHTADLAVEVEAPSREELFAEALRALTGCLVEPSGLEPRGERTLEAEAPDLELLLADWLNEALGRFDAAGELYLGAEVRLGERDGVRRVEATARFDRFDPARHVAKMPVKGVTYHGLEIARAGRGWRARLVFDV